VIGVVGFDTVEGEGINHDAAVNVEAMTFDIRSHTRVNHVVLASEDLPAAATGGKSSSRGFGGGVELQGKRWELGNEGGTGVSRDCKVIVARAERVAVVVDKLDGELESRFIAANISIRNELINAFLALLTGIDKRTGLKDGPEVRVRDNALGDQVILVLKLRFELLIDEIKQDREIGSPFQVQFLVL